jgi:predicted acetyltransferase
MIDRARDRGMRRALAVCAVDNPASARTIERCGGVYERTGMTKFGPVHRYWIDII